MAKPWIKLHVESLDNPKTATLSLATRGVWSMALLVAERYGRGGLLPPPDRFALMAHCDADQASKAYDVLESKGLLDRSDEGLSVHDWDVWQASKPSDAPAETYKRLKKWRESKKKAVITPDNALSSDADAVITHDNALQRVSGTMITRDNALSRVEIKSESEIKREKKTKETPSVSLSPSTRAPASVQTPEHTAMIVALMSAAGVKEGGLLTPSSKAIYDAAASEIMAVGGKPDEVPIHATNYLARYDAALTPKALAAHWPETHEPPTRPRTGSAQRPVTYARQKLEEKAMASAAVDEIIRGKMTNGSNGVRENVQAKDERDGGSVRHGRVRVQQVPGVLGSSRQDD